MKASKYPRTIYLTYVKNPDDSECSQDKKYDCKSFYELMCDAAIRCGAIVKVHVQARDEEDKLARDTCKELSDLFSSDLDHVISELQKEEATPARSYKLIFKSTLAMFSPWKWI
jgi:hypothetical protein